MHVRALAATGPKQPLTPFEYDLPPVGPEQVDIRVRSCGLCHSDYSMWANEWGITAYPFVPGHEVVGEIEAVGSLVSHLKVGQTVGLGWYSHSCQTCKQCLHGDQNLCPTAEQTIVGRHGGFATHVRASAEWVTPLPAGVDAAKAGPLFCGGVTVFNPIIQAGVLPTHRVGVVGIGGLGHMALQFLNKWGCEVVAFSSNAGKRDEVLKLGAHRTVDSRDKAQLADIKGTLDFILSTVNVTLDWPAYLDALAPRGRLHTVGAINEPVALPAFPMIVGQKSFGASPLGSPGTVATMLEFCARHKIAPVTETFPLSKANEALAHLEAGKARYRIVLENDL